MRNRCFHMLTETIKYFSPDGSKFLCQECHGLGESGLTETDELIMRGTLTGNILFSKDNVLMYGTPSADAMFNERGDRVFVRGAIYPQGTFPCMDDDLEDIPVQEVILVLDANSGEVLFSHELTSPVTEIGWKDGGNDIFFKSRSAPLKRGTHSVFDKPDSAQDPGQAKRKPGVDIHKFHSPDSSRYLFQESSAPDDKGPSRTYCLSVCDTLTGEIISLRDDIVMDEAFAGPMMWNGRGDRFFVYGRIFSEGTLPRENDRLDCLVCMEGILVIDASDGKVLFTHMTPFPITEIGWQSGENDIYFKAESQSEAAFAKAYMNMVPSDPASTYYPENDPSRLEYHLFYYDARYVRESPIEYATRMREKYFREHGVGEGQICRCIKKDRPYRTGAPLGLTTPSPSSFSESEDKEAAATITFADEMPGKDGPGLDKTPEKRCNRPVAPLNSPKSPSMGNKESSSLPIILAGGFFLMVLLGPLLIIHGRTEAGLSCLSLSIALVLGILACNIKAWGASPDKKPFLWKALVFLGMCFTTIPYYIPKLTLLLLSRLSSAAKTGPLWVLAGGSALWLGLILWARHTEGKDIHGKKSTVTFFVVPISVAMIVGHIVFLFIAMK